VASVAGPDPSCGYINGSATAALALAPHIHRQALPRVHVRLRFVLWDAGAARSCICMLVSTRCLA